MRSWGHFLRSETIARQTAFSFAITVGAAMKNILRKEGR